MNTLSLSDVLIRKVLRRKICAAALILLRHFNAAAAIGGTALLKLGRGCRNSQKKVGEFLNFPMKIALYFCILSVIMNQY